jgi:cbb3-type cytochrome oxidase subunit 3
MNHVLREGAATVQLGWLLGVMTAVFLATFLFWIWWAWSARNKARWEAESRLPLNDGGES